jgi:telomere length regulation protein
MEGLFTPVSTSYKTPAQELEKELVEIRKPPEVISKPTSPAASPAEALEILRNEPDYEALISTLRYLRKGTSDFNITSPSPLASQLVHVLVSEIVPSYWSVLQQSHGVRKQGLSKKTSDLKLLLLCLRSVTGLNAVLLSLKQTIQQSKDSKKSIGGSSIQDVLTRLLQLMSGLLEGDETIETISESIWGLSNASSKQKAIWNEFLSIVGGGRILGICAEADDIVNELSKDILEKHWASDGVLYSRWFARNITHCARTIPLDSEDTWKCCVEFLSKALRLGYSGRHPTPKLETCANRMQKLSSRRLSAPSSLTTLATLQDLVGF